MRHTQEEIVNLNAAWEHVVIVWSCHEFPVCIKRQCIILVVVHGVICLLYAQYNSGCSIRGFAPLIGHTDEHQCDGLHEAKDNQKTSDDVMQKILEAEVQAEDQALGAETVTFLTHIQPVSYTLTASSHITK